MLTTNQKGLIAEAAVIHECIRLNVGVARPIDDERYDLNVDLRPKLLRLQCKWASLVDDVVVARLYSNRRGPNGMITRRYSADEIDYFAVHCAGLGRSYLLPANVCVVREIRLRLRRARNNQLHGVRWARDFEFAARLKELQGP